MTTRAAPCAGKIVYPLLGEDGEVLTWFGRDPEYEGKVHEWVVGGKQGKEPEKHHFVTGFARGLELFGQHRLREEETAERLARCGLLVVQGPNDVIALDALGVPAVGLCATTITGEQVEKVARFSAESGHGAVTVMLDCTEAGTLAARVIVVELAQVCPVRLAWSETMHGGSFKGREVASLSAEEWRTIAGFLGERSPEGGDGDDRPVGRRHPLCGRSRRRPGGVRDRTSGLEVTRGIAEGFATISRRTPQPASPPRTPGRDRRGAGRPARCGCGGSRAKLRECGPLTEATFCLPQAAKASAPSARLRGRPRR